MLIVYSYIIIILLAELFRDRQKSYGHSYGYPQQPKHHSQYQQQSYGYQQPQQGYGGHSQ